MAEISKAREVAETCEQADPRSPAEHFVARPIWGQIFDCRDDDQMRHHTQAQHQPQAPRG